MIPSTAASTTTPLQLWPVATSTTTALIANTNTITTTTTLIAKTKTNTITTTTADHRFLLLTLFHVQICMMLPFDFFQLWISKKIFKELDAPLFKTVRLFMQGIERFSRLKLKFFFGTFQRSILKVKKFVA